MGAIQVKNVPEELHAALRRRAGINAEVLSVLRGWLAWSLLTPAAAARGVRSLATAPVTRLATDPLIIETWSLRDNVTPYDAAYVVVARRNACPLLTWTGG